MCAGDQPGLGRHHGGRPGVTVGRGLEHATPYTQLLLSAVPDPKAPPPSLAAMAAAAGEQGGHCYRT